MKGGRSFEAGYWEGRQDAIYQVLGSFPDQWGEEVERVYQAIIGLPGAKDVVSGRKEIQTQDGILVVGGPKSSQEWAYTKRVVRNMKRQWSKLQKDMAADKRKAAKRP